MPNVSVANSALAQSSLFTNRLQVLLGDLAMGTVLSNTNQSERDFAYRVMADPGGMAGKVAIQLVGTTNLTGTNDGGTPPDSTASDAAIASQLVTSLAQLKYIT